MAESLTMDPLPLRLHRAISILSRSSDPDADDAQSACGEVAARIIRLEEALWGLLFDDPGARKRAEGLMMVAGRSSTAG